jgi:hypothetical protein
MMAISGEFLPTLKPMVGVAPIAGEAASGVFVEVGNAADVGVSSSDRASR